MFHILDRSAERDGGNGGKSRAIEPNRERSFVLHMEENRSCFPQDARGALVVMVTLLMATSILPALKGYWLVPLFSLGMMALLVWALEHHQKSAPKFERLELGDGELRYSNSAGHVFALPSHRLRFELERPQPANVRLLLCDRTQRHEIGTTLNVDERIAVAPLIAGALGTAKSASL